MSDQTRIVSRTARSKFLTGRWKGRFKGRRKRPYIVTLILLLVGIGGCLPDRPRQELKGPISIPQASVRISELRSDCGKTYSLDHNFNGKKIKVEWALGSALKRTSKLQMRAPVDLTFDEVTAAMQVVLDARESNPWYHAIDATTIDMTKKSNADNGARAVAIAPDSPYQVAVKAAHHKNEWFVEVDVRIVDENGDNVGL